MKHIDMIIECDAKLLRKNELPYEDLATGRGVPILKPIYEVVFLIQEEEVLFALSSFEYDVLEEGNQGKIKYRKGKYCNELISFADKIKEVIEE